MNFLDTYDLVGSSPASGSQPEQSLNEEVSEVMGHIGRFWGGFRRQSQTVLQTAVIQAQKELNKLTSDPDPSDAQTSTTEESTETEETSSSEREASGRRDSTDTSPPATSVVQQQEATTASASTSTIFSRLQSTLPPGIVATVTNHLPESLRNATENVDLAQLRTTVLNEFQRVQGVTRVQAEEYAHKSEALLREAVKEAGDVLRDAVKIIPPETSQRSGLVWDGTDMWSLPSDIPESAMSGEGQLADSRTQRGSDAQLVVATRAESLFKRLKNDPDIIRHDPEADPELKERYLHWISSEVDAKGGITGEEWSAKISALLDEPGSGLKATQDVLVPAELTSTAFWTRFLFRAHQIEAEEEKRKALVQGVLEDEDFSWEDDEEEAATATDSASALVPTSTPQVHVTSEKLAGDTHSNLAGATLSTSTSATSITRESEESYDVVSPRNASPRLGQTKDDSDDQDSDWE